MVNKSEKKSASARKGPKSTPKRKAVGDGASSRASRFEELTDAEIDSLLEVAIEKQSKIKKYIQSSAKKGSARSKLGSERKVALSVRKLPFEDKYGFKPKDTPAVGLYDVDRAMSIIKPRI